MLQWSTAIFHAHHSSACANLWEQYQNLLTRWYFTPLCLAKAYESASPYCWRSCGWVGSVMHVFWSCSLLWSFWDDVFSLLSSIIRHQCLGTPELALLLIGIDNVPQKIRPLVSNILHTARLTIGQKWKSSIGSQCYSI